MVREDASKTHPEIKLKFKNSLLDFSSSEVFLGSTTLYALLLKQSCIQSTANMTALFVFHWEHVFSASSRSTE